MSIYEQKSGQTVVGQPLDRVDGRLKVTGIARYPAEFPLEGLVHAVIVQSTIACGRIKSIDASAAEAMPGVVAVFTHHNAPRLQAGPANFLAAAPPPPLQDDRIHYNGQHVALVVAETLEQATFAATLVSIDYEEETPLVQLDDERAQPFASAYPDVVRGEPDAALAEAAVRVRCASSPPSSAARLAVVCAAGRMLSSPL